MRGLLAFLWSGCWHKWAIIDQGMWRRPSSFSDYQVRGQWRLLQCEKCGNVKQVDLV